MSAWVNRSDTPDFEERLRRCAIPFWFVSSEFGDTNAYIGVMDIFSVLTCVRARGRALKTANVSCSIDKITRFAPIEPPKEEIQL